MPRNPLLPVALCAAAAVVVAAAPAPVATADLFQVRAGGDHDWAARPIGAGFNLSEDAPIQRGTQFADGFGSATVDALASHGRVRAKLTGQMSAPALQTRRFNPNVFASAQGTVVFSGPAGSVTTRPNIHLSGTLNHPDTFGAFTAARTAVHFRFLATHESIGIRFADFDALVDDGDPTISRNAFGFPATAAGASVNVSGTAPTPEFLVVPVGVPVSVEFSLTLSTNHLSSGLPGASSFSASFENTASFATDGPAWELPPGFTVNGFGIEDNVFVPEPASSAAAAALGAVASLLARRPRRA